MAEKVLPHAGLVTVLSTTRELVSVSGPRVGESKFHPTPQAMVLFPTQVRGGFGQPAVTVVSQVEVLSGLKTGDAVVVEQSYLIKADIEKSGASHDH